MPKAIFVGAGPVGLMSAIQLKLYNPDLEIVMLEKYQVYKRKHALLLDQSSFADTHPDPAFQAMLKGFSRKIRTNELEDQLLQFAKTLGITIQHTNVTDCDQLAQQYPDAEVIVGADGSHSVVHKQVFNHEYQIQKNLQYIAEMKYEVEGPTRGLSTFTESVPAMTYANHFVSEFIGKEKDGRTPVAIRVFVDKNTYEQMRDASFKNPYTLDRVRDSEHDAVTALHGSLNAWVKARASLANEKRVAGSERITVTNLPVYAAKTFVKQHAGKTWALVGDAAFGVPYFRSLNNGILCSSQLAKALDAMINHRELNTGPSVRSLSKLSTVTNISPEKHYEARVQALVRSENFVAEVKNVGVSSLQTSAAASQSVPVSRSKLMTSSRGRRYKRRMSAASASSTSSTSTTSSADVSSSTSTMFSKKASTPPDHAGDGNKISCTVM